MSLAGYTPETKEVSWEAHGKPWTFSVRGLTLPDLTSLVASNLGELDKAVELWNTAKGSVYTPTAMQKFLQNLIRTAPGLVAEVLAIASGEPEQAATYATIPFGISMQALAGLIELTLKEISGLKNLQAALAAALPDEMLESLEAKLKSSAPSTTTGGFEKTLASSSLRAILKPDEPIQLDEFGLSEKLPVNE